MRRKDFSENLSFPMEQHICQVYILRFQHPCGKNSQKQQHKDQIDHVCVQVSEYEGIRWKFMNARVSGRRIMADEAGGFRKPVVLVAGQTKQFTKQAVKYVMEITGAGYGCRGKKTAHCFPSAGGFEHLPHDGKRHYKHERRDQCAHHVVGILHFCKGKFCKIDCKVLAAVIVVDRICSVPDVSRGHIGASVQCSHETIIHRLFCACYFRTETDEPGPDDENRQEENFFCDDETDVRTKVVADAGTDVRAVAWTNTRAIITLKVLFSKCSCICMICGSHTACTVNR